MGGFDMRRILHGEQEFELLKPILVGDTLTGVSKVADIIEKEGGRGGKMTMLLMETEYTNQRERKGRDRALDAHRNRPGRQGVKEITAH